MRQLPPNFLAKTETVLSRMAVFQVALLALCLYHVSGQDNGTSPTESLKYIVHVFHGDGSDPVCSNFTINMEELEINWRLSDLLMNRLAFARDSSIDDLQHYANDSTGEDKQKWQALVDKYKKATKPILADKKKFASPTDPCWLKLKQRLAVIDRIDTVHWERLLLNDTLETLRSQLQLLASGKATFTDYGDALYLAQYARYQIEQSPYDNYLVPELIELSMLHAAILQLATAAQHVPAGEAARWAKTYQDLIAPRQAVWDGLTPQDRENGA